MADNLDKLIKQVETTLDDLIQQAARGDISVEQWFRQSKRTIRDTFNAAGVIARDGERQSLIDRARAWNDRERAIRKQTRFLRTFRDRIRQGDFDKESLLGLIRQRARMYGNAAREHFFKVRQRIEKIRGRTEKRRVLSAGADHCNTCLQQAGLGWVPIDSPDVTSVGEGTECLSADRCRIDFR